MEQWKEELDGSKCGWMGGWMSEERVRESVSGALLVAAASAATGIDACMRV